MKEESIEFETKDVFYNPAMQFSRSFSSLAVGVIGQKLDILDAFCASGIRGIRYKKENKNVSKISFLDLSEHAIKITKTNVHKNKIKNGTFISNTFARHFANEKNEYDFIEIDPFGTPAPYLGDALRFSIKKEMYLSLTATDTAVLCGPQAKACLKNYHAKNLNNEFTHETGTRLLIKRVMDIAGENDRGIVPLFSLSNRHYIKLLLKVEKGAEKAYDNLEHIGYISYCISCGFRKSGKRIENNCPICKNLMDYAGPLWLGPLHEKKFLRQISVLNKKRNYTHQKEIARTLSFMTNEISFPPYFYDLHRECKRIKVSRVPKLDIVIKKLCKKGTAVRTHFAENGIKTDCTIKEFQKILRTSQ